MKDLVMELTGVFGPSGDESIICEYISEAVKDYADDIRTDALGNLIVYKKGLSSEKKIMFAAHMDSIGLMVTYIEDNGCMRFTVLGGVAPAVIANQKVIFKNGIVGVVSYEGKDCSSTGPMEKFYIDIGTSSREETSEFVSQGDTCVYFAPSAELANDMLASPYIDNRVSCAILMECIKSVKEVKYDTYFVFTTQEEVGMRGAKAAAFGIMPDIGIAVDVTIVPEAINPIRNSVLQLGAGPAIKIKDHSVVCSPMVKDMLVDIALKEGIPYQLEIIEFGGCDTAAIQLTGAGIPAGCISIPIRYVHTMSETVSMVDVENALTLVSKVVETGAGL